MARGGGRDGVILGTGVEGRDVVVAEEVEDADVRGAGFGGVVSITFIFWFVVLRNRRSS